MVNISSNILKHTFSNTVCFTIYPQAQPFENPTLNNINRNLQTYSLCCLKAQYLDALDYDSVMICSQKKKPVADKD